MGSRSRSCSVSLPSSVASSTARVGSVSPVPPTAALLYLLSAHLFGSLLDRNGSGRDCSRMQTNIGDNSLQRSMQLSIVSGAAGTVWMVVCAPQAIFNVFVRNELGIPSTQLGLLVGILSLTAVLQPISILVYGALPRRKPFWITTSVLQRVHGLLLAGVAFAVARGAGKEAAFRVLATTMVFGWMTANVSSSGWWSWMADLIPIEVRARFFGRRSAVAQAVNIAAFFATTVALDAAHGAGRFVVYGVVFLIGGISGVFDILLHIFMPEPARSDRDEPIEVPDVPVEPAGSVSAEGDAVSAIGDAAPPPAREVFLSPLRDRNFLRFSLITGIVLFSINVSAPFFAPYITASSTIGASNTWLGIMFVISQLTWIAVSPAWGTIMDRFGRKPAVMIGLLFTLSWIGYIVITPANYTVVLPVIALIGGVFAPAFWDGINQLMLSLAPANRRLSYVAWYWTIIGVVSAGGSLLGGVLDDRLRGMTFAILGIPLRGFHVVVLTSLALVWLSMLALARVDEGPVRPMSYVFSRVATPGIFRTFLNIGVLARNDDSQRVLRSLRSIDSASDDIAVEQVMRRTNDPDADVREEAVRALGRLRSPEATDLLLAVLHDPHATNRIQAARALGRIGDPRAIPRLVDAMADASSDLREACVVAIGEIGGDESVRFLHELLQGQSDERLAVGSASALSRHGFFEAAWEIVPRLIGTGNPVLRSQLAIALANVLGRPGDFYRYVTGDDEQQAERERRLVRDASRRLQKMAQITTGDAAALIALASDGAYRQAIDWMRSVATRMLVGDGTEPADRFDLVRRTYDAHPRLAVWYWFLEQTTEAARSDEGDDERRLEFLVACLFLRGRDMEARGEQTSEPGETS